MEVYLGLGPVDAGATGWLLVASALVLLMTPGVAFFYGGMVRQNNVLGMIMQSFVAMGIVGVAWTAVGFSLAFAGGSQWLGDLRLAGLPDLDATVAGLPDGVPLLAFAGFQLMFAMLTPALVTGATAERWRFAAFVVFVVFWSLLVYAPIAHWVFSPEGWAHKLGAIDFAGGTVVHANAGAAALAMAIILGRRHGWPEEQQRPHNLPFALLGAALLWFGWLGFNGGSALNADGVAATAVFNSQLSASVGLLAWITVERVRFGKATTLGAVSGAISGLVAITPAAGYVTPMSAILIGLAAGAACQLMVGLKTWFRLDDSLDVVAVHLGGGIVGSLCVGLFATSAVNPKATDGLFYGGGYSLLAKQAGTLGAVVAYSFVMTLIIGSVINRLIGNRVRTREEVAGLDLSQHGEAAYEMGPTHAVRGAMAPPGPPDIPPGVHTGLPGIPPGPAPTRRPVDFTGRQR